MAAPKPDVAPSPPAGDAAERVLNVVRDLVLELHPERERSLRVDLTSRLDRDLGLDSLGRAELLLRLEREFGVQLEETLLAEGERPGQLLSAVLAAEHGEHRSTPVEFRDLAVGAVEAEPVEARTLTEILDWHEAAHPERPQVLLWLSDTETETITYGRLAEEARAVARALRQRGLGPGERAAIMLPTGADFFFAFFGILYAGAVPVPIYPPMRLSQLEDHMRRQATILNNAEAAMLITVPEAKAIATLVKPLVPSLRTIAVASQLRAADGEALPTPGPGDVALMQYTSGSTGDPKGVVLTHANIVDNVRIMIEAMEATSTDVFMSWLPLYHDMGLIGAWLGSLYAAVPVVIMSPLAFLARPERWLWAIHRHRATLSVAPNFAFELCLRRIDDADLDGLDLSALRMVLNGAEPVSPRTIERFTERFASFGFRPEALTPVYGLAENSVGLAFPVGTRRPLIHRIQRSALGNRGEALPAAPDDDTALEFVACGQPLGGHQVRVIDATGREVGERHEGRLQFRGPSATSGYFRNEARTAELFDGEWLDSGDLAYISGGDIFITGRAKDLIIRAGRNIYPHEVEEAVGNLDGVRKGCVAVFGSQDPATGTERLVVLAETRETDAEALAELRRHIDELTTDILEMPPDDVALVPPQTVPKTSSGKIRRTAARGIYESGRAGSRQRAVWWQVARLGVAAALPQARRWLHTLAEVLFAGYWWSVVGVVAGVVWSLVVVLPHRTWRWTVLRGGARMVLRLTGARPEVTGLEHLPAPGGIVVANHESYVDGLALCAALPGEMVFAVKKELEPQFLAGLFLRRLGMLFVEREDAAGGVDDTAAALAIARAGRRLAFFAEGTLTRAPGLLDFRLGAFVIAARAGAPVIPVTLRGTRSILRGDQWFPRRGPLAVTLDAPVVADGPEFEAAVRLRDAVRARILERSGEPDLARERQHLIAERAPAKDSGG